MLLSRTIAGTLLAGLLWIAGPVSAGDTPTADEQYMLELINRMRLNPDGEVYRLSNRQCDPSGERSRRHCHLGHDAYRRHGRIQRRNHPRP
jgi:hypothetical protein